jgi:hypothetical protein
VKVIQGSGSRIADDPLLQRWLNKYARIEASIIAQTQMDLFDRGGGR